MKRICLAIMILTAFFLIGCKKDSPSKEIDSRLLNAKWVMWDNSAGAYDGASFPQYSPCDYTLNGGVECFAELEFLADGTIKIWFSKPYINTPSPTFSWVGGIVWASLDSAKNGVATSGGYNISYSFPSSNILIFDGDYYKKN